MFTNRYAGECHTCKTHVDKNKGIYNWGKVYCTEPRNIHIPRLNSHWDVCINFYNIEFGTHFNSIDEAAEHEYQKGQNELKQGQERVRQHLVDGGLEETAQEANVRSLTQVITKVLGSDIQIADMTFEQITKVRNQLLKRIDRKANKAVLDEFKANNQCPRCGGAGESDKWIHTGKTCYRCGGSGRY